jgi:hypothetical protein
MTLVSSHVDYRSNEDQETEKRFERLMRASKHTHSRKITEFLYFISLLWKSVNECKRNTVIA